MVLSHRQNRQGYYFYFLVLLALAVVLFLFLGGMPPREREEPPALAFHADFHPALAAPTDVQEKKCALLFFGLPRAFRTVVLPSITKNVLRVNAKYGCDVYAHYYRVDQEKRGRGHKGGKIEKDAVNLMREEVANAIPGAQVHIIYDTDEQFWSKRNATVQKYRLTKDASGNYLYFPWKDKGYIYPDSMDNIVKQWHSINAVFEEMESTCQRQNIRYQRVAMLRLDVFYATPLDVFQIDKNTWDRSNQYAVLPAFGKFPVNDRLFYGPYQAAKVWATERFARIEDHVVTYFEQPGYGMHSERFLNYSILPAIEQLEGVLAIRENPDICVMRVRADESIWAWDCNPSWKAGATRGFGKSLDKKELIEGILERNCTEKTLSTGVKPVICDTE